MLGRRIPALLLIAVAAMPSVVMADDGEVSFAVGRSIVEIIEELRQHGVEIAYSSRLLPPGFAVTVESDADDDTARLMQVLEPYELTLESDAGVILVVRKRAPARATSAESERPQGAAADEFENITVSASRYEISRDLPASQFTLDRRTIETMPDVGEDPIRITQRLPGAAASGASARAHFRGGEQGEVGIILNGQRLFDPFHVRDYQNIFSAIDARAIDGVEVYTGGFPVRFGDRMSGLVLMESMDAEERRHTEIGVSVYNTSVLHASNQADRRWLLSARRGNLDVVLDRKVGRPAYYDIFGQIELDVGRSTTVTANVLYADDIVTVVLETDPAEREEARSRTKNAQAWLQIETDWSDRLSSRTGFSITDYRNRRDSISADPDKVVASVADDRDIRQVGLRQDWTWQPHADHLMHWGFGVISSEARYTYDASAAYFGLPALFAGQPAIIARNLQASPDGGSYSLYVADRWKLSPQTTLEWGLRWDDQTYTGISSDSQLSPRLSVLHRWSEDTDIRLSWGRYHQSQGIHELQIEDGITRFWPAQAADHLIAGIQHRLNDHNSLRFELFHKNMRDVRPRFENLFDPLALIPELQADRVRLDPVRAESSGLELSLEGGSGAWSWWASYTLSKATDNIAGRNELRNWDQRHAAQSGISWSNESWDIAVAASSHTGWPTTSLAFNQVGVDPVSGEPQYEAVPGQRNELRHSRFASLDLRVSRSHRLRRGTLTWFVEVSNATNRRNVCCVDWDTIDGSGGTLELENSQDFWLPLLPAIGVLWEF